MCFKTGAPNLNNACSKGIPGPQPVHGEIQPHGQTGQFTLQLYEVNTPDRVVRFVPGRQYEVELKGPLPLRGFLLYPANGSFVGVPRDYADKVRLTTDCPGVAALTHKTPAPAVSIRGYWQAPVKGANSTIRATVMPMPLGQGPVYIFSQTLLPLSDDARLESLTVNELVLVPPFHPELLQYEVVLPFSQSTVQLLPRAMAGENVEILVDGEDPITVFTTPVGTTEYRVLVTAEDGVSSRTYLVLVTRATKDPTLTGFSPVVVGAYMESTITVQGTWLSNRVRIKVIGADKECQGRSDNEDAIPGGEAQYLLALSKGVARADFNFTIGGQRLGLLCYSYCSPHIPLNDCLALSTPFARVGETKRLDVRPRPKPMPSNLRIAPRPGTIVVEGTGFAPLRAKNIKALVEVDGASVPSTVETSNASAIALLVSLAVDMGGSELTIAVVIDGVRSSRVALGTVWQRPLVDRSAQQASQEKPVIVVSGQHLAQAGEETTVSLQVHRPGSPPTELPSRLQAASTSQLSVEILQLRRQETGTVVGVVSVGGIASAPVPVAALGDNQQRLLVAVLEGPDKVGKASLFLRMEYPPASEPRADSTIDMTLEADGATGRPLALSISIAGAAVFTAECPQSAKARVRLEWTGISSTASEAARSGQTIAEVTTTRGRFTGAVRPVVSPNDVLLTAGCARAFLYGKVGDRNRAAIGFLAAVDRTALGFLVVTAASVERVSSATATAASGEELALCGTSSDCDSRRGNKTVEDLASLHGGTMTVTTQRTTMAGDLHLLPLSMSAASPAVTISGALSVSSREIVLRVQPGPGLLALRRLRVGERGESPALDAGAVGLQRQRLSLTVSHRVLAALFLGTLEATASLDTGREETVILSRDRHMHALSRQQAPLWLAWFTAALPVGTPGASATPAILMAEELPGTGLHRTVFAGSPAFERRLSLTIAERPVTVDGGPLIPCGDDGSCTQEVRVGATESLAPFEVCHGCAALAPSGGTGALRGTAVSLQRMEVAWATLPDILAYAVLAGPNPGDDGCVILSTGQAGVVNVQVFSRRLHGQPGIFQLQLTGSPEATATVGLHGAQVITTISRGELLAHVSNATARASVDVARLQLTLSGTLYEFPRQFQHFVLPGPGTSELVASAVVSRHNGFASASAQLVSTDGPLLSPPKLVLGVAGWWQVPCQSQDQVTWHCRDDRRQVPTRSETQMPMVVEYAAGGIVATAVGHPALTPAAVQPPLRGSMFNGGATHMRTILHRETSEPRATSPTLAVALTLSGRFDPETTSLHLHIAAHDSGHVPWRSSRPALVALRGQQGTVYLEDTFGAGEWHGVYRPPAGPAAADFQRAVALGSIQLCLHAATATATATADNSTAAADAVFCARVNDAPLFLPAASDAVPRDAAAGTVLFRNDAGRPGAYTQGEVAYYAAGLSQGAPVQVDALTGTIVSTGSLTDDVDSTGTVSVRIAARDSVSGRADAFTLFRQVCYPNRPPAFSSAHVDIIARALSPGDVIATVGAADPNLGGVLCPETDERLEYNVTEAGGLQGKSRLVSDGVTAALVANDWITAAQLPDAMAVNVEDAGGLVAAVELRFLRRPPVRFRDAVLAEECASVPSCNDAEAPEFCQLSSWACTGAIMQCAAGLQDTIEGDACAVAKEYRDCLELKLETECPIALRRQLLRTWTAELNEYKAACQACGTCPVAPDTNTCDYRRPRVHAAGVDGQAVYDAGVAPTDDGSAAVYELIDRHPCGDTAVGCARAAGGRTGTDARRQLRVDGQTGMILANGPLDEGVHVLYVQATRDDGVSAVLRVDVIADATPPSLRLSQVSASKVGGMFYSNTSDVAVVLEVTPAAGAGGPPAKVECFLDSRALADCPADTAELPATLHLALNPGRNRLAVRYGQNGPSASALNLGSFVWDNAAPDARVTRTMEQQPNASAAMEITMSAVDGRILGSPETLLCRLDAGALQPCPVAESGSQREGLSRRKLVTVTLSGLSQGNHTLDVLVVDAAGNTQSLERQRWHMSIRSLLVGLTKVPQNRRASGATAFFTVFARNAASLSCSLDGVGRECALGSDGNADVRLDSLATGRHTLSVTARDVGGAAVTSEFTWNVVRRGGLPTIANPVAFGTGGVTTRTAWELALQGTTEGASCALRSAPFPGTEKCCQASFLPGLCRDICLGDGVFTGCQPEGVEAFSACLESAVVAVRQDLASTPPLATVPCEPLFAVQQLRELVPGSAYMLSVSPGPLAAVETSDTWVWAVVPPRTAEAAARAAAALPSTCPSASGGLVAAAAVVWLCAVFLCLAAYWFRAPLRIGMAARGIIREAQARKKASMDYARPLQLRGQMELRDVAGRNTEAGFKDGVPLHELLQDTAKATDAGYLDVDAEAARARHKRKTTPAKAPAASAPDADDYLDLAEDPTALARLRKSWAAAAAAAPASPTASDGQDAKKTGDAAEGGAGLDVMAAIRSRISKDDAKDLV